MTLRGAERNLSIKYNRELNLLLCSYSGRSLRNAVGIEIYPDIIVGVSPNDRVVNWVIKDPVQTLSGFVHQIDKEDITLKEPYKWRKRLDQQQASRLLSIIPENPQLFLRNWVISN